MPTVRKVPGSALLRCSWPMGMPADAPAGLKSVWVRPNYRPHPPPAERKRKRKREREIEREKEKEQITTDHRKTWTAIATETAIETDT